MGFLTFLFLIWFFEGFLRVLYGFLWVCLWSYGVCFLRTWRCGVRCLRWFGVVLVSYELLGRVSIGDSSIEVSVGFQGFLGAKNNDIRGD